jgi:hypothetical protein
MIVLFYPFILQYSHCSLVFFLLYHFYDPGPYWDAHISSLIMFTAFWIDFGQAFSITQALEGRLGRGSISQASGSRDGIEPLGSSVCNLALGWHVSMEEQFLQTSDEVKPDRRFMDILSVDSGVELHNRIHCYASLTDYPSSTDLTT